LAQVIDSQALAVITVINKYVASTSQTLSKRSASSYCTADFASR
jgi:hypothetical protein